MIAMGFTDEHLNKSTRHLYGLIPVNQMQLVSVTDRRVTAFLIYFLFTFF